MSDRAAEKNTPDFRDLGRSTPWSSQAWIDAWDYLSGRGETRLWRLVKDLMPLGSYRGPVSAAIALVQALESAPHPRATVAEAAEKGQADA